MQIRLSTFVRKEMLHILRDSRTLLVVIVIPIVLILLFGFTVSTDVKDIKVAVCAPGRNPAVDESVARLSASSMVHFYGYVDEADIDRTLRTGRAGAVIVYAPDYPVSGRLQILIDGTDVNSAGATEAFLRSILSGDSASSGTSFVEVHHLYNPQMESSFNFIPGIMGMIFMLICAMMTSVSIVKEKETGTMEMLLVSPVKPAYIIISKLIPYLLLSFLDLLIILILAKTLLHVPMSGGYGAIIGISVLYLLLALSLGILVSGIAKSQIVALLVSAMVMMMPVLFFSGMMFPLENLPWALRWIGYVIPARWYIDAMRKLMIEGVALSGVLLETGILLVQTILLVAISTKRFNDRLA